MDDLTGKAKKFLNKPTNEMTMGDQIILHGSSVAVGVTVAAVVGGVISLLGRRFR